MVDPEGVEQRSKYRLCRRRYVVPGPNHIYHIDGYDKLKPYGFSIHGCIDGFSRYVLWLAVGTTNNKPEVIAHHFVRTIMENGYTSAVLRVDAGNENPIAGLIQQALRHYDDDKFAKENSYIVGPSTANVRIERYWGEARAHVTGHYIDFFKILVGKNIYNNKDLLDRDILRFCFGHLIQRDLTTAKNEWNSHRIRAQKARGIPTGIPNVMYNWPEKYGARECKKIVDRAVVQRIKDRFTIQPELYDAVTKDFIENLVSNVTTPKTSEEAFNLYQLIQSRRREREQSMTSSSD